MFVSNWMTRSVYTVTPETSVSEAVRLMKEKRIKHIPVVIEAGLKGLLSDRDVKEYTPSKATTLDIYELHYILIKIRVDEIMKRKVFTTTPDTPIEEAAMVMLDNDIGCLPVIERERLVGIISDRDIFRVLVDITGIRSAPYRFCMTIQDRPGSIKDVADVIREHGFTLQSILTSYQDCAEGCRDIVIRAVGTGNLEVLKAELLKDYPDARIKT